MRTLLWWLLCGSSLTSCMKSDATRESWTEDWLGLEDIIAVEAVAVQMFNTLGDGTADIPMRLVNAYGIAVPGGPLGISVTGALESPPSTIEFDEYGYGATSVRVPVDGIVDISLDLSESLETTGSVARVYRPPAGDPPLPLSAAYRGTDVVNQGQWIATGTAGVAVAGENEVWWVPMTPGEPAHRVAELPSPVQGLVSAEVTNDDVFDLVVWTEEEVLLLSGRPVGGYGWVGGWSIHEASAIGVVVDDVNSDGENDLVLGMATRAGTRVDLLLGDGMGGFDEGARLRLSFSANSLAGHIRDGVFVLSVVNTDDDVINNFRLFDTGWEAEESTPPGIAIEPGTRLLPSADINNREDKEIILQGPIDAGEQVLTFYDLGSSFDAVPTKYPMHFGPFYATTADVNGSGGVALLVLEDDLINAIHFTAETEDFTSQATMGMGKKGPFVAQDFNGDGLADLAILEQGITLREGTVPDMGGWSVEPHSMRSYALNLFGPVSVGDYDDDGGLDVLGITNADEFPEIRAWSFVEGTDGLPALQTMEVTPLQPGLVLDFAHCGSNIYTLIAGLESTTLHRVILNAAGGGFSLEDDWGAKEVTGDTIACGRVTASANGVAVSGLNGTWVTYDSNGDAVDSGTGDPVSAITMADTDGDGMDEVHACSEDGCDIIAEDLDGDGQDELIVSGTEVQVNWGAWTERFDEAGILSTSDVNADGRLDLLVFDDESGTLSVHRGLNGGLAPAWSIRTDRDVHGPVFLADVNRDGKLEFLAITEDGKLVHSRTD